MPRAPSVPRVTFLRFTVGTESVDKENSKVEEVKNWPIPKTMQYMLAFLGLAGFYRKFVHKFAEIARPLRDILKSTNFQEKFGRALFKKAPVELDEKALTTFENLKQALIPAQCLVMFDPTKCMETWADASRDRGTVGAVLMQVHWLGLQPEAFLSKVMTQEQQGSGLAGAAGPNDCPRGVETLCTPTGLHCLNRPQLAQVPKNPEQS